MKIDQRWPDNGMRKCQVTFDPILSVSIRSLGGQDSILKALFILTLLVFVFISQEICLGKNLNEAKEYEAKAALLYNFAKFVTWPESAFKHSKSPFVIAILGKNIFGNAIKTIEGMEIHGRPIKILYFHDMEDFEPCHILYFCSDDLSEFGKHSGIFPKHHVLTVGEKDGFVRVGGVLLFMINKDHLAFKVNIAAAREANLQLNANLLNLAKEVIEK